MADEVPLFTSQCETRRRRLKRGRVFLVLLAGAIQCAIVLAVPLDATVQMLGPVAEAAPTAAITDVASLKAPVAQAASSRSRR